MILVGVAGNKGSGKNTFAKECINDLACNYGKVAYEMSWAELLKVSAAKALGYEFDSVSEYLEWADSFKQVADVYVTDNGRIVQQITGREFLQNYGTEAHREVFDDDFWVNAFWNSNIFRDDSVVFICDCRFPNEIQSIKEHGGIVVQIQRDNVDNNDSHASEQGIDLADVDIIIDNNSTIEELKESAEVFINEILS